MYAYAASFQETGHRRAGEAYARAARGPLHVDGYVKISIGARSYRFWNNADGRA